MLRNPDRSEPGDLIVTNICLVTCTDQIEKARTSSKVRRDAAESLQERYHFVTHSTSGPMGTGRLGYPGSGFRVLPDHLRHAIPNGAMCHYDTTTAAHEDRKKPDKLPTAI